MKLHALKLRTQKHENYECFTQIYSLNKQNGWRDETRCAYMERNCFILSHYSFTRRELSPIWIIQWNLITFQYVLGCIRPASLFMACKERYNLCMNHASLDRESLDRVSWTSTTLIQTQYSHWLSTIISSKINDETLTAFRFQFFSSIKIYFISIRFALIK